MIKKSLPFLAIATFLAAGPALALDVKKSVDVAAAPDAAWKAVGDFCGIGGWHPAVAKCEISTKDGATVRTITLKDGAKLVEKQTENKGRSYTYVIVDGPLPVSNYKSTISVEPKGSGSAIVWVGAFDAKGAPDDKVIEAIGGIYDSGLTALAAKLK